MSGFTERGSGTTRVSTEWDKSVRMSEHQLNKLMSIDDDRTARCKEIFNTKPYSVVGGDRPCIRRSLYSQQDSE